MADKIKEHAFLITQSRYVIPPHPSPCPALPGTLIASIETIHIYVLWDYQKNKSGKVK